LIEEYFVWARIVGEREGSDRKITEFALANIGHGPALSIVVIDLETGRGGAAESRALGVGGEHTLAWSPRPDSKRDEDATHVQIDYSSAAGDRWSSLLRVSVTPETNILLVQLVGVRPVEEGEAPWPEPWFTRPQNATSVPDPDNQKPDAESRTDSPEPDAES
jgi:hypothetical protein